MRMGERKEMHETMQECNAKATLPLSRPFAVILKLPKIFHWIEMLIFLLLSSPSMALSLSRVTWHCITVHPSASRRAQPSMRSTDVASRFAFIL